MLLRGLLCLKQFFYIYVEVFNIKEFLVNEQIKSSVVEVIGDNGQRLGQMSKEDAISMAEKEDKDLVLVGINANPPISQPEVAPAPI